ncbi:DUF6249 domain-containing protein [Lysobacter enzymogenes]|uniref:Transmembrane protein n=1 Tax=Lysobacter enzymogenes TaxID=69 RepID=A0A3N2RJU8_LYSEN|nr:DUF6249 domain-containing protein [Lysobacter enzymogenes]ROU07758.1 hypothetical protein D9T17_05990 [Lysobacter enzymogenes]
MPDILVPITLFVCIAFAIKVVVEARVRGKLAQSAGSEELLRSLARDEDQRRRHGALRWGIVLVLLAIAFAIIEAAGWRDATAGTFALLLGAVGLGNLAYYAIVRKLD